MRTLPRNCELFSSRVTWASGNASAQAMAAKNPAAPPPTTTTRRKLMAPTLPHKRRPRYSGKNPRRFEERYKEHDPARYADTVAQVLAAGKAPAPMHRPLMVAAILAALDPKPGEIAVDGTLGFGGHAQVLLPRFLPGGRLLGFDADPIELPKAEARLRALGFGAEVFTARRSNFAALPQALAAEELAGVDMI